MMTPLPILLFLLLPWTWLVAALLYQDFAVTRFNTSLTSNVYDLGQGDSSSMSRYASNPLIPTYVDMGSDPDFRSFWFSNLPNANLSGQTWIYVRIASKPFASFKLFYKDTGLAQQVVYRTVQDRDFELEQSGNTGIRIARLPISSFGASERLASRSSVSQLGIVEMKPAAHIMTVVSIGFSAMGPSKPTTPSAAAVPPNFVRVRNGTLVLNNERLHFVSYNAPDLLNLDDADEQEDLIRTFALFANGSSAVTRSYCIASDKMVTARMQYSQARLESLDRVLMLANRHGVKLILPFIDYWEWEGGILHFLRINGLSTNPDISQFYTNATMIAAFKHFIAAIVGRTNSLTGLSYIQDPSILAWELGNELMTGPDQGLPPTDWIRDISSYIKTLDPNHLVMDGSYADGKRGAGNLWTPAILELQSIDLLVMSFSQFLSPISPSFSQFLSI